MDESIKVKLCSLRIILSCINETNKQIIENRVVNLEYIDSVYPFWLYGCVIKRIGYFKDSDQISLYSVQRLYTDLINYCFRNDFINRVKDTPDSDGRYFLSKKGKALLTQFNCNAAYSENIEYKINNFLDIEKFNQLIYFSSDIQTKIKKNE